MQCAKWLRVRGPVKTNRATQQSVIVGVIREMQLPVCTIIAWLTIILFALMPKRLSTIDFVFLYCVVLSLSATSYTFFELNLHSVTVPRTGGTFVTAAICRLITIPLLIMMSVDALQTSAGRRPQWLTSIAIWFALTMFDWGLSRFNVITYHHSFGWHLIGTSITYLGFIAIPWGLTWWYKRFDVRTVRQL